MKQQIGRLLSTLLLATFSLGITAGVIQGTIIDKQTKEPLTGATVQIAGTTTGTVADVDGNYTLTLSNGTYTIEVKYIGYKTLRMNEVKVKANATLNFELEVDAQTLDAVRSGPEKPGRRKGFTARETESNACHRKHGSQRDDPERYIERTGRSQENNRYLHCKRRTTDSTRTG